MSIVLPNIDNSIRTSTSYNMLHDGIGKYWFYHRPSDPSQKPGLYKSIVTNAQYSIDIWDPYFHVSGKSNPDHLVFDSINDDIKIRILTSKGLSDGRVNYLEEVYDAIKLLIPASKNISFCVGVINTFRKRDWKFHDRFLIVDRNEVYIIGASVEFNHSSLESCGIYKITTPETANFINIQFDTYWNQTEKQPTNGVEYLYP
jgi:hypothetical protein